MAQIVFSSLAAGSTPDTVGDGIGYLPALRSYGSDSTGNYGIGYLPALAESLGAGFRTQMGAGIGYLPALQGYATNNTVGLYVTYTGYATGYLPAMTGSGFDAGLLIPSSGHGLGILPALAQSLGTGYAQSFGDGLGYLPALRSYGSDSSGNYGIGYLPALRSSGLQVLPTIDNSFLLQQSTGYTQIFTSKQFYSTVPNTVTFGETTATEIISVFNETLRFGLTPVALASLRATLMDNLALADPTRLEYIGVITETLTLTGDAVATALRIVALVDSLVLSGVCNTTVAALAELVDILALNDVARSVQDGSIADSLALTEALTTRAAYYAELVANAAFSDSMVGLAAVTVLVPDGVAFNTTLTPLASLLAAIKDELEFSIGFNLGDTPYVAYAMNTVTKGLTRYSNFKFDSLAGFNGQVYASGAEGLYKLGGTTDAGAAIPWRIRTGLTNFGSGRNKGMDAAYLGYTATGRIVLKCIVVAPGSGDKIAHWYELTAPVAGAAHAGRILTGRGLRSVYWAFDLTNVDAGTLALDTIELHPVVFEGRLP